MALRLDSQIQYLKGVGPKLADIFNKRGVRTVKDLIEFYPRSYEDRRAARDIASLKLDEVVSIKARIISVHAIPMGKSSRKIYDVILGDVSGRIHCKYFRVPYRGYFERFQPHQEVRVVGKVINYRGRLEFHHPDIRDVDPEEDLTDDLVPLYTEIEGLSTSKIQRLIQSALAQVDLGEDPIPLAVLQKYDLISKKKAIDEIHKPNPAMGAEHIAGTSRAHRRLIFEEFFWLELFLAAKRSGFKKEKTFKIRSSGEMIARLLKGLPFQLTGAQKRAFEDIKRDFELEQPMNRLIQGDVGSGKTLVAFMSVLYAQEAGFQSCMMAPTEILSEQHFRNAQRLLEPLGVKTELLTGSTKAAERKRILTALASGETHFVIGTHALIEEEVVFKNLGFVVIDEQHRFGVNQRARLKSKGRSPHFLIMTATPIPRTLAMTVYGDLDVSTIDEMPPGRSPIQTRVTFDSKRQQAMLFLLQQLEKGRQAYIIYPLVEESEKIDLKDAVTQFESLKAAHPSITFDLLHGRMKSEEKDEVMNRFRRGETQVLVSTTVIEVGVDVPNANIILIEHAERFGLSQLHQLRGRVGRGEHKSYCILIMGYAVSEEAKVRTMFMETTTDGFKVSEFDLELRGPGEFMGTRQSGLAGFKLANIVRDTELLQKAREAAFEIVASDRDLKKHAHTILREELLKAHGPAALAGVS